jgi:hypothetical protein
MPAIIPVVAVITTSDRVLLRARAGARGVCDFQDPVATSPCRHCERSEAIHLDTEERMDCFVADAPRNDVERAHSNPTDTFPSTPKSAAKTSPD